MSETRETEIDFSEIFQIQGTQRKRSPNPTHYVVLDNSKLTLPDGKEITLNKEGWEILTSFFKTASGKLMAKRLVALINLLQKQKQKKQQKQ